MEVRKLGAAGPEVSAIGLGCWGMSGSYGPADEAEATATIRLALDLGVTLIDTADSYGEDGHNESLVGRALAGRRERAILATKTGFLRRPGADGKPAVVVDARPDRIRAACEASLARLATDHIDLYYLHRADPGVPIEESIGAMADLVATGKVGAIGLSEVSVATLRRAHASHPIAAVQSEYSLWTRDPEAGILAACAELGVAFVPFSPLGRGFLTGAMTDPARLEAGDWRAGNERFSAGNLARNLELLGPLLEIARAHGARPGQVALAWVLSRGSQVVPIPGMKRRAHLEENVGAISLRLTPDDLARLDAAFPPGVAAGARYNSEQARWLGG
jgi:aryl-alcohol dehydrogenase-like predicted oxidoreductase